MSFEIILFVFLLAASGFFSASETALTSLNEVKVHRLITEKGRIARPLQLWIDRPGHYLATILICNNVVNIGASALATVIAFRLVGGSEGLAVSIATGVTTIVVLMFGEITPKNFAKAHSEGFSLVVIRPLTWLGVVLFPIVHAFTIVSTVIVRAMSFGRKPTGDVFSEEDLKASFKIGRARGILDMHEKEMLTSVLEFSDTKATEIMVPRVEIDALPLTATLDEIKRVAIETGYSRFPVYDGTLDRIVGVLHVRDILSASESGEAFDIAKLLRKALFVPETLTLPTVLRQMKTRQLHLGFVVNEYGGLEGIVTLEDVLEELVGEIEDEHDEAIAFTERRESGEMILNTRISLREAARILGFAMPETTVNSLAGFLIEQAGRIPRRGDRIVYADLEFIVLEATRRRLLRVEVRPLAGRTIPSPTESSPELRAVEDERR